MVLILFFFTKVSVRENKFLVFTNKLLNLQRVQVKITNCCYNGFETIVVNKKKLFLLLFPYGKLRILKRQFYENAIIVF